jgi:hypothetical protein
VVPLRNETGQFVPKTTDESHVHSSVGTDMNKLRYIMFNDIFKQAQRHRFIARHLLQSIHHRRGKDSAKWDSQLTVFCFSVFCYVLDTRSYQCITIFLIN